MRTIHNKKRLGDSMKKLIAANWKMYKTFNEARTSSRKLFEATASVLPEGREVIVFAPFTALQAVDMSFVGQEAYQVGAQDVYPAVEGAFTGEISPHMLLDAGCRWVLVGHSERRHVLGENDALVARKTLFSIEAGLHVILCVGESLEEREAGQLGDVMKRQLFSALENVNQHLATEYLAVAYEPIWAIGTGKVAGPEEILEAHALIRSMLVERYGEFGHSLRILYGGSVKPDNAASIMALDNVDGVLVGGASLQAASFSSIILA